MSDPTPLELEFLRRLSRVGDFTLAARSLGNRTEVLRATFQCVSNGWVSHGSLTAAGKALALTPRPVAKPEVLEIVVLPTPKRGAP